jgi:predicted PurR-regulated permease PerM
MATDPLRRKATEPLPADGPGAALPLRAKAPRAAQAKTPRPSRTPRPPRPPRQKSAAPVQDTEVAADASAGAEPTKGKPAPRSEPPARGAAQPSVPWRIILASIGCVLAAGAAIELLLALQRVIGLLVISSFLALVLSPAVAGLVRLGLRRGLATLLVFLVGLAAIGGLGYLFIHPLYKEAVKLSNDVPGLLARTQQGKGTLGKLIKKYHLESTAARDIPKIRQSLGKLGGPAYKIARRVLSGLGGLATVMVLTFLLLLEGPELIGGGLSLLPPERARRIRGILQDVNRSVTGYVLGNVATSLIAGLVCFVALTLTHVPFATVFGVWVAMVDLLPLLGGLLAGVPTVAFAFLHSPSAGIVLAVVFLVYQQIENHILNPIIMSRTVKLNPLWVILSVLAGAELAGIGGALIAIPAAASVQVIIRDIWNERRSRAALIDQPAPEPSAPPGEEAAGGPLSEQPPPA